MRLSRIMMHTFCTQLILALGCVAVNVGSNKSEILSHYLIAYGRKWRVYTLLAIGGRTFPELLTGERASGKYTQYLEDDRKNKVVIQDHIFILQKSGQYKRYEPGELKWSYSSIQVFTSGDRLFVQLVDKPGTVTDLPIQPPLSFRNDTKYKDSYLSRAGIFYGEFDPSAEVFRIHEFVPDFDKSKYSEKNREGDLMFFFRLRSDFTLAAK